MKGVWLRLYLTLPAVREALKNEKGQDLVEYALIIAVICLGIVSGTGTLANGINNAMATVSGNLNRTVS